MHVIYHVLNHHKPVKATWWPHGASPSMSTCTCSPLLRNAFSTWCSSKYWGKASSKPLRVLLVPSCTLSSEHPFDQFVSVSLHQPTIFLVVGCFSATIYSSHSSVLNWAQIFAPSCHFHLQVQILKRTWQLWWRYSSLPIDAVMCSWLLGHDLWVSFDFIMLRCR